MIPSDLAAGMKLIGMICYFIGYVLLKKNENKTDKQTNNQTVETEF